MTRPTRVAAVLGALNLLGVAAYLRLAAPSWAIPAEVARGIRATTAEPFLWALGALPVLLLFAAVDVAWGVALATGRAARGGRVLAAVALVWAAAVALDLSRH